MGWVKAMKVEKWLREKILKGLVGEGSCFVREKPYCMVGMSLEALGIKQVDFQEMCLETDATWDDSWDPVPSQVDRMMQGGGDGGIYNSKRSKALGDIMEMNDSAFTVATAHPQREVRLNKAAEMMVSFVKEHVPDEEDQEWSGGSGKP